jgi:hypothetical protein
LREIKSEGINRIAKIAFGEIESKYIDTVDIESKSIDKAEIESKSIP